MKENTHKMDHVAGKRAPLVRPGFTAAYDYFGRRVRLLEHFLWHRSFRSASELAAPILVLAPKGGGHSVIQVNSLVMFNLTLLVCFLCQTLFPRLLPLVTD